MPPRTATSQQSKNRGIYNQLGRPPKGWTPPKDSILKIKKGKFIITFL